VAIGDYPTQRTIPNNRTGYTFDGFYTEENGLGEQLFRNNNVSWNPQLIWALQEPCQLEQDITLYAYWVGKEYTCFLRTDPYQYQVQITVTYGQPMPTVDYHGNPLQIPQRNYYHFLSVSRNGVTFYNPDMTSATTWQIDYQGTILEPYYILSGDWKGYEYTIKFDTNGANEKIPNRTIRYGDKLNFPNLTKTGYTVSAWWLNNIGAPAGGTFLAYANSADFSWMPDLSYTQDLAEFTEFTILNDWRANNYLESVYNVDTL